jgi:hypothetical protein
MIRVAATPDLAAWGRVIVGDGNACTGLGGALCRCQASGSGTDDQHIEMQPFHPVTTRIPSSQGDWQLRQLGWPSMVTRHS